MDTSTIFENPWNPAGDLVWKCYNQNEWEGRLQTMMGEEGEEEMYNVANFWGDVLALKELMGMMEKIMIPNILLRKSSMNQQHITPIVSPNGLSPADVYTGTEELKKILGGKEQEASKLQRMFFEEGIYPQQWRKRGVLERQNGTRKWKWQPLLLQSMMFNVETKKTSISFHSIEKNGYGSALSTALSAIGMTGMFFNISTILVVMRSLISTMIEDDLTMQTSKFFLENHTYWRLWVEWLQVIYDDLGFWQQTYDKKGVWNMPNGKLFRIMRPFTTLFPCMSQIIQARSTMDKTGVIRMLMYTTHLFIEWTERFVDYLFRERLTQTATEFDHAVKGFKENTLVFLRHMSSMGITNVGYEQSILWNDVYIEEKRLPFHMYVWNGFNFKKIQQLKNILSIIAYQRTLLFEFIESIYPLNDVFKPNFLEYGRMNLEFYEKIQEIDFKKDKNHISEALHYGDR